MKIYCRLNDDEKEINNVYYIDIENKKIKFFPELKDMSFLCNNFRKCSLTWNMDDYVRASIDYDSVRFVDDICH